MKTLYSVSGTRSNKAHLMFVMVIADDEEQVKSLINERYWDFVFERITPAASQSGIIFVNQENIR